MTDQKKCAFAVCAHGDRFSAYKWNMVGQLKKFVPGIEIVDLDESSAGDVLACVPEHMRSYFVRLAIPLMERFRGYDRVVWVDSDVEIVSSRFAGILEVATSSDGLAAVRDIDQDQRRAYMRSIYPDYDKGVYFLSGVLVMDLCKIGADWWRSKVEKGIADRMASAESVFHDQDVVNRLFDIKEMDLAYNTMWMLKDSLGGAYLIHYANNDGKRLLDNKLGRRS